MFLTKCGGGRDTLSKSFGPIFTMEVMENRLKKMGDQNERKVRGGGGGNSIW